uniref:4Fe-4S ferredoxin-type domain-containing protein n=1 Tax=Ignisphaera aggregans TaxID=334771 RepID=A0A7C4BBY2_9CREN
MRHVMLCATLSTMGGRILGSGKLLRGVSPSACLHCANAKCRASRKRGAIARGGLGEVLIDMGKCDKCLDRLSACSVGATGISRGDIVNCDLCLPLRQVVLSPACLSMCPF